MKLVIAEKPMLARDIARAICGKEVSESARLPISGNGYTVIACAGHLLELVEPDAVNPAWGKPWSLDVLPIQIDDWAKEPTEDKKDLVERIDSLLPEAECVINAGDPDDEGQLIVDEVLDYLGYEGEVLRISTSRVRLPSMMTRLIAMPESNLLGCDYLPFRHYQYSKLQCQYNWNVVTSISSTRGEPATCQGGAAGHPVPLP